MLAQMKCVVVANTDINLTSFESRMPSENLKHIDGETMAADWSRDEREITEMKCSVLGADGVQVFRVKLEAAIDKHDATFLSRTKNRIYARNQQHVSGVGYGF